MKLAIDYTKRGTWNMIIACLGYFLKNKHSLL